MVAVFWGGVNSAAAAARKGQEKFGCAFRIALVLENNLKVIAIHPDILVREHTSGVSYTTTMNIVYKVIPHELV